MECQVFHLAQPRLYAFALFLLCLSLPIVVSADNTTAEFAGSDKIDGFGLPEKWLKHICADINSDRLDNTDEVNKAASAVGTTLMALLPALVTFGPLPTAPLRELLYLSPVTAFWTALMRLGLPMEKIPLMLSSNRMIKTTDLFPVSRKLVQTLGTVANPTGMPKLAGYYDEALTEGLPGPQMAVGLELLHQLQERVLRPRTWCSLRRMMALVLAFIALQEGLFMVLTYGVTHIGTWDIIWLCPREATKALKAGWSSSYFWIMWIYVACLLPVGPMLYAKSTRREKQEVFQLENPGAVATATGCRICSVQNSIPPATQQKTISASVGLRGAFQRKSSHRPLETSHPAPHYSTWSFLKKPQPVVVVIRLSDEVNDPIQKLFSNIALGVFGAFMLIILTFLFGSIYGGQLFLVLAFLTVFAATIITSRVASIAFYVWAQRATQLTIIECDSVEEMRGMARILCAMPGVLVQSRTYSYSYLDGQRLGCDHSLPSTRNESYAKRKFVVRLLGLLGFLLPLGMLVTPIIVVESVSTSDSEDPMEMGKMAYAVVGIVVFVTLAMPVTVGYILTRESADRVGLRWQYQQPDVQSERQGDGMELSVIEAVEGKEQTQTHIAEAKSDGVERTPMQATDSEENVFSSTRSLLT